MPSSPNTLSSAATSPYVKEVTAQNFMQEVIQASLQTPVLVYFTATWCQPCKQFGPTLEKVVNDAKGRLKLAKVDMDKNPQLAQQFRVQSVPMVYIFFQGQPLDGFSGAMQESQLKQLLAQFLTATPEEATEKEMMEAAARLLAEGNAEEAARYYQALLDQNKDNIEALAGLVRAFIATGKTDQASALLLAIPEEQAKHEAIVSAKAALLLVQSTPTSGSVDTLQKKVATAPDDHAARYELASALFAAGKQEEAIQELLCIITKNKDWNEGAARAQLLKFFEALGHTHPLTMQGRRKLSTILFS